MSVEEIKNEANANNKRCLGCAEILTDDNAKEHYRTKHPVLYTMAYDSAAYLADIKNPATMAAAASFALCGKCKRETPPCQYCAPVFSMLDNLRTPASPSPDVD